MTTLIMSELGLLSNTNIGIFKILSFELIVQDLEVKDTLAAYLFYRIKIGPRVLQVTSQIYHRMPKYQ